MNIKQLIWRDNTTDFGKTQGLVEIVSTIGDLFYCINNHNTCLNNIGDKFYFSNDMDKEFTTLEEAKIYAQKYFEKTILDLFFE